MNPVLCLSVTLILHGSNEFGVYSFNWWTKTALLIRT